MIIEIVLAAISACLASLFTADFVWLSQFSFLSLI